jgi:hypothetical protein
MGLSPSPKSSPRDARSSPSPSGQRTLTPQRKHRKMLKDGTSEVWPESVEKIFVQGAVIVCLVVPQPFRSLRCTIVSGLRQYWESPWATYSRGRSRWRNQFLVDYLKEAGIERSKKQVASHIQVLRNMWKGEKGMSRTSDSSRRVSSFVFLFFPSRIRISFGRRRRRAVPGERVTRPQIRP